MKKHTTVYKCPDGSDFPVGWDDPQQAELSWRWDQMHTPLPITPLSIEFSDDIAEGFFRVADMTGSPFYMERHDVKGYRYIRIVPFQDDVSIREAARVRDAWRIDRVLELWESEYRPEVEALTRATLTFDETGLTLRQLVERLDQVHAARRRLGELHMLAMLPVGVAGNRLMAFCAAEFGAEGEQLGSELMQGFPNKSVESGIALWDLSHEAKARPEVSALLTAGDSARLLDGLAGVRGGPEFRSLLEDFLEVYGHRNESFGELAFPTWREDPSFPIVLLRQYLNAPDDASPARVHEQVVRHREQLTAETEARLGGDGAKLDTFRAWLKSAQQRTILLEDHNFYIDQKGWSAARFPCLAIGRRLVEQGAILSANDVFYLQEREIQNAAVNPDIRLSRVVDERRRDRERWRGIVPPAHIGSGRPESVGLLDSFFGPSFVEASPDGVLRGVAASRGVVRGTARVILSLDEVDRLGAGEILVTHATAPPWTPLFAVAGALVTEAGGILSHAAVVAREYKIPAVVGARGAIQRIQDGMLITVDGTAGTVRIESEA